MKRAISLMGLTALNTLAVFLYQWYVVTRLGPGEGSDALFAGMVVPQLVLNVINGSLAFVLVPLLSTSAEEDARHAVWTYAASLGLLFGGLSLVLAALASLWVPVTVPGFDPAMRAQTVELTRVQLIGMALSGISAPFASAYQARHKFVYPLAVSVLASAVSLAFLVLSLPIMGVVGAAWGLVIRSFVQSAALLPIALPFALPNYRSRQFRESIRHLIPLISGSVYYKSDQLVDRLLASLATPGALSLLHLAQQINGALFQVLVNAIAGPAVPTLSALASTGRQEEFQRKYAQTTWRLIWAGAAIYVGILAIGLPLLSLVFQGRKFTGTEVRGLWTILLASGLFWLAGLWGQILSTTFYAIKDTRTPTKIGVIGFTLGIPLKIGGFLMLGVPGIVLGSGLFSAGNAVAMHCVIGARMRAGSLFSQAHRLPQT